MAPKRLADQLDTLPVPISEDQWQVFRVPVIEEAIRLFNPAAMSTITESGAVKCLTDIRTRILLYRRHLNQADALPLLVVEQFVQQLHMLYYVFRDKFPKYPWDTKFPDFLDLAPSCDLPSAWLPHTFKIPPPPVTNPFSMSPAEYKSRQQAKASPAAATSTSAEGSAPKKKKNAPKPAPPAPPEEPPAEDPPKSVIKTVRKTAGGKELRSLPASAPLPAKPAKSKRKSSTSAPKSKVPPPPSPSPAQSDYAPSNDEEPEAEETEAEVEAEAEAETAVEAAASDGGPEDEDEFASTLHSHAEYDAYNHDVHPTTNQRRRDEMPINAPKLIPRALVITSILPQPYQRAMFSCPTCITRNTRCIFYKWNMACWACSQGSMRCAFTHSGVEFMRVQDRMEPMVGISNSYLISLLTTLVRSRRNLELQYSIVRKFGMEYEQDLNDFAVHYFQAETVLPRHHFISKFESEDSVEMIQQLFDRLDVTYESALADYRKRHPPAKTQLYEPVQPSEPVYREAKELPAEEFSVPRDQLPLDFTNKFVLASDAASADIPQPPLTEQAKRSQPPRTFNSDARPFNLNIVPDSVFANRAATASSTAAPTSATGPSTASRPKPLSRARLIDTPPIAVLADSPSPPKPRSSHAVDAPQARSSLLSEPHRPAWTPPISSFGLSVPAPARSSQSFLDVKKDSGPVFGPPGPLLSYPPPAPSSSSTAMTYRPYSERPDSTPSSAQPAQRTRRPTPPDETMDSSWVPDSQNQFISSDTPSSQVLLSPSLDPSRPLQPVEDDDMYGDYPDDAAPAQERRQ
ncbi:hypothetical protein B0H11DRAFT_2255096 [Mycena galericulata]|nr:hypothetical protein B0H11DRAFT_2255096 [Mycena galericulata]